MHVIVMQNDLGDGIVSICSKSDPLQSPFFLSYFNYGVVALSRARQAVENLSGEKV